MKRLKTITICFLISILLCGFLEVHGFALNKVFATEETVSYSLLSPNFANSIESLVSLGIDSSEIDDFTPYNENNYQRMSGKSLAPKVDGEEGNKKINKSINLSSIFSTIDVPDNDTTDFVFNTWMFFDEKLINITKGISFVLSDDMGENKIKFELGGEALQALLTRTSLTGYDDLIFSSVTNAKVGWCYLSIPFTSGVITGDIATGNKFNLTKLTITQEENHPAVLPISFYDISLSVDNTITETKVKIQEYANIKLREAVVVEDGKHYYMGEYFDDVLTGSEVFIACYIGRENYLNQANISKLVAEADPGLGRDKIVEFNYGSNGFKMVHASYDLRYCIKYNGNNYSLLADKLIVSSYGKGVWLKPITGDLVMGKEYKLFYEVHEAFSGDLITFTSSDEEVLKIVDVNKLERYIIVKAEKKGDATIKIVLTDDRLIDTSNEEGLVNEDFSISVVKETKNVNTTKVLLWITLGLFIAGLIYLAVRAIISARKVEVK